MRVPLKTTLLTPNTNSLHFDSGSELVRTRKGGQRRAVTLSFCVHGDLALPEIRGRGNDGAKRISGPRICFTSLLQLFSPFSPSHSVVAEADTITTAQRYSDALCQIHERIRIRQTITSLITSHDPNVIFCSEYCALHCGSNTTAAHVRSLGRYALPVTAVSSRTQSHSCQRIFTAELNVSPEYLDVVLSCAIGE